MPNLELKASGFIEKSDFKCDFANFYNLGNSAKEELEKIEKAKDVRINGLGFRLGDSGEGIIYDDFFYLTKDNQPHELNPLNWNLDKVESVKSQIRDFVGELEKYKFRSSLIEFSLFIPQDKKAKLFYTFVYAATKEAIVTYVQEMLNNVSAKEGREGRGPILPDPNLYDFPLLQLDYPDSVAAPVLDGSSKKGEKAYLFIASQEVYEIVNDEEGGQKNSSKIKDFVANFFEAVQKKVFNTKETECRHANDVNVNTAILIPLLRPAGIVESLRDKRTRLKGGGLLLFGNFLGKPNIKDQSIKDMALWIINQATSSIMNQSNTNLDLETEKYKSKAAILHYIPYVFSESVKKLINYEKSHPDFQIPTSLYIVAVETALYSRGFEKESLKKFIFGLPVEETLKDKGLGAEVFKELGGERGISRLLAEYSLATHSNPIFSTDLTKPEVVVEGYLPFEKIGLTDDVKIRVFIALLIVILKESIEHTERYIKKYSPDDEDYRKVRVLIEDHSITVKNPVPADMSWQSPGDNGTQLEPISLFSQYLSPEWQIEPKSEDGWWAYSLSIIS